MVHVTRFEPEVVQAIARHLRQGNLDQTETTPMKAVVSHGVTLGSRYQKAEELEAMDVMVEGVDPRLRGAMAAIWCDSKATRTYLVTLKGRFGEVARLIAAQLGEASGVYNGIILQDPAGGVLVELSRNGSEREAF
jgi:hypothetical protein